MNSTDNPDDLLSPDENINYFDEKEYSTVLVNRDGFTKKQEETADLIEMLFEKEIDRPELESIYSKLKELKAQDILMDALQIAERPKEKAIICTAIWESGVDVSSHFLYFTELALNNDFALSLEALTVLENIEAAQDEVTLTKALELAQNHENTTNPNVKFLIENIKSRFN